MNTENLSVTIDPDVLTKVFLMILNKENMINNTTYLAAVEKLEKGDKNNVH